MKKQLNAAIAKKRKQKQNVGEVDLFQEMAHIFNQQKGVSATYVKEVHRQVVEYPSNYYKKRNHMKMIELGDLLFLTYDKDSKIMKICVMQVKYRREPLRTGGSEELRCRGDIYQWELLHDKPDVTGVYEGSKWIPPHILNFRKDYMSITEFGVFYPVNNTQGNQEIEFKCIPPKFFCPSPQFFKERLLYNNQMGKNVPKGVTLYDISQSVEVADIPKHILMKDEYIVSEDMDSFEENVLNGRIGAPIGEEHGEIKRAVCEVLRSVRNSVNDATVIGEVLEGYMGDDGDSLAYRDQERMFDGHPAVMLVVLGADEKEEESGNESTESKDA